MSSAEGWDGDQGGMWGRRKDKRIVSEKSERRRKKNSRARHRGRGHAASRRQGEEGREHLETSVSKGKKDRIKTTYKGGPGRRCIAAKFGRVTKFDRAAKFDLNV